jgi:hypothetical protein
MRTQLALCMIALSLIVCDFSGSAIAGPLDGPILEAQTIVIQGDIRGHITNGKQGSKKEVCIIFCVTKTTDTTAGLLNVNGIVQHGSVMLRANTIVLQNDLPHNLDLAEGTLNYKGIMQLGR